METQNGNQKSEIVFRETFTASDLEYWGQFGISESVLDRFHVRSVVSFQTSTDSGRMMKDQSSDAFPIFAYEINKNCHKIYEPLAEKRFRFRWIGSKPENHLFGLQQLPFSGDLLFLAAGEKDCLTLAAQGFSAFTLNSETATLPKEMAESLKARFKNILVAYDLDETGIRSSQKLADTHGFAQLRLPAEMRELEMGKDVSDFFKATLTGEVHEVCSNGRFQELISEATSIPLLEITMSPELATVLHTTERLKEVKSKPIEHEEPILTQLKNPILFRNTINFIQGKSGVHKSRLAEMVCSQFLMRDRNSQSLIGMETEDRTENRIVYIDTERNHFDQFPAAIQRIQAHASYPIEAQPHLFEYYSLLEITRAKRFPVLKEILEHLRKRRNEHLIIILDVLTDCVQNFNDPQDSLQLIDLLNVMINKYDATFLCVIHENPGSEKARGHLGTEIHNKATTVIQIRSEGEDNELFKLRFLKCRASKRLKEQFLVFSEETHRLEFADAEQVRGAVDAKKKVATASEVAAFVGTMDEFPTKAKEFWNLVMDEFGISDRTARERIKEILDNRMPIPLAGGASTTLKAIKEGRDTIYSLDQPEEQCPF